MIDYELVRNEIEKFGYCEVYPGMKIWTRDRVNHAKKYEWYDSNIMKLLDWDEKPFYITFLQTWAIGCSTLEFAIESAKYQWSTGSLEEYCKHISE